MSVTGDLGSDFGMDSAGLGAPQRSGPHRVTRLVGLTAAGAVVALVSVLVTLVYAFLFAISPFAQMAREAATGAAAPAARPPDGWLTWVPSPGVKQTSVSPIQERATAACGRGRDRTFGADPNGAVTRNLWLPCRSYADALAALGGIKSWWGISSQPGTALVAGGDDWFGFKSEGVTYVGSLWIQDNAIQALIASCQHEEVDCRAALDKAVRSLSTNLPGRPQKLTDFAGQVQVMPFVVITVWLVFVAPERLLRWIRRPRYESRSRGIYRDVRPGVRRARKLRAARKIAFAIGLVAGTLMVMLISFNPDPDWIKVAVSSAFVIVSCAIWLRCRRAMPDLHLRRPPLRAAEGPAGVVGSLLRVGSLAALLTWAVLAMAMLVSGLPFPVAMLLDAQAVAPMTPLGLVKFLFCEIALAWQVNPVFVVLLSLFAVAVAVAVDRLGRRLAAPSAAAILARDQRPPVLYLRSFDEDQLRLPATWSRTGLARLSPVRRRRFEELLATLLTSVGPVVAISPPGTKLPTMGAARITLDNDVWQGQVQHWAGACQLILLGATPQEIREGYGWELELVAGSAPSRPIMVVVAPHPKVEIRRRFAAFVRHSWQWTWPLDDVPEGILVAGYRADRGWKAFGATRRTDATYALAMRECLAWLGLQGGEAMAGHATPMLPAPAL